MPAVLLRPLTEDDLVMLHAWLQRPHVTEWWAADDAWATLDGTRREFHPQVLAAQRVTPYIAMLEVRPIGFAHSYVALGCGDGWWEDETDPGVRGIDQFLCEGADLGRGLGTRMVCALVDLLFADPAVTKIQTDPHPRNARAIRCYEKAGFRAVREIVTPDGPALYMVRQRDTSMQALTLRAATEHDIPFLLALRRRTMSAHLAASGIDVSEADHLQRLRAAFDCASIVLHAGEPVGLLKVVRQEHEWELVQIQLAPSVQGRGFGTLLLQSLVAQARCAHASLKLSVLKTNPAKRLYERLGFITFSENAHSYEMVLAAP